MFEKSTLALGAVLAIGSIGSIAVAGPDWIEDGDAGSTVGSAQNTTAAGALNSLAGNLGSDDHEDVYRLIIQDRGDIANPINFGLVHNGPTSFNPALWLFDSEGYGVLGNDDDPILGGPNAHLLTPSTDGVTLQLAPGIYYLAVTESGNVPLSFRPGSSAGIGGVFEEIFFFASSTEVSGPDGVGFDNPLAAWSSADGVGGTYGVVITPAPSGIALLTLGSLGMVRRRR